MKKYFKSGLIVAILVFMMTATLSTVSAATKTSSTTASVAGCSAKYATTLTYSGKTAQKITSTFSNVVNKSGYSLQHISLVCQASGSYGIAQYRRQVRNLNSYATVADVYTTFYNYAP